MVETLCGIMAGGPFGKNIREWAGTAQKADLVIFTLKSS